MDGTLCGTTSKATVISHFPQEKCWAFKWERKALVLQGKNTEAHVVLLRGISAEISLREIDRHSSNGSQTFRCIGVRWGFTRHQRTVEVEDDKKSNQKKKQIGAKDDAS